MSYSKKSIFYNKPYPQCALENQINLVNFIERTIGVKFTGKTLGEMSRFIDENIAIARSSDTDDIDDYPDEY